MPAIRFLAIGVAIFAVAATNARADTARASCATRLAGQPFSYMELMVGSPEGKNGRIAQNGSEFDKSGKHGRDIYPLADETDVFLRCHYEDGRVTVAPVPPGTRQCEVDYHYIDDYDTRADRVFCR